MNTVEHTMYNVYIYDTDTGETAKIIRLGDLKLAKEAARRYNGEGFNIKIVDDFDGCVIYTLG
jgi:proteasome assembly chaperone (PAC2) family protein